MEKEQTTIRLPVQLKEQLQKQADERGHSFNGWITYLLKLGTEIVIQNRL